MTLLTICYCVRLSHVAELHAVAEYMYNSSYGIASWMAVLPAGLCSTTPLSPPVYYIIRLNLPPPSCQLESSLSSSFDKGDWVGGKPRSSLRHKRPAYEQ
jgi:phage tail protein X